jgi:hypothetical protein
VERQYPRNGGKIGCRYKARERSSSVLYLIKHADCECLLNGFKNSLIIHEENTKKNHKRFVSLYVIEISLDLHKL